MTTVSDQLSLGLVSWQQNTLVVCSGAVFFLCNAAAAQACLCQHNQCLAHRHSRAHVHIVPKPSPRDLRDTISAALTTAAEFAGVRSALAKQLDAMLASQLSFAEPVWATSHAPSSGAGEAADDKRSSLTLLAGAPPVTVSLRGRAPAPAKEPTARPMPLRRRRASASSSSDSDDEEERARLSSAAVPVDRLLSGSSLSSHRVST
jgi:hypothetical protein